MQPKIIFSKFIIIQILLICIFLYFYKGNYKKDLIANDVIVYYSYIPATFICKDIGLELKGNDCSGRFWPFKTPNGGNVIKMSMGMSILYSPFFFVGHTITYLLNEKRDGYSYTYQRCLAFGSLFYLMLGLVFLRKVLRYYFEDFVVGWALLLLFLGTNLLYYSTEELLMPPVFLFSLISIILFLTKRFYDAPTPKIILIIGFLFGLIVLIRPTIIILLLIPVLFGVRNKKDFKERNLFFYKNPKYLTLFSLMFILPWIPQFMYWKYITGDWIFYSYMKEKFFFLNPHIVDGLFGYRKGFFVYTPIMFLAGLGFFGLKKYCKEFTLTFLLVVPIFVYVTFSWWCWWYGGSLGQRALIDLYPIMAFPLANTIRWASIKKNTKTMMIVLCEIFIVLNLFQTWQYENSIIHFDSMTKKAYWGVFGQASRPDDYYERLVAPNYNKALRGLPERITVGDIHLTGLNVMAHNNKYLRFDGELLIADEDWVDEAATIEIKRLKGDKVVLLNKDKKYAYLDELSNELRFTKKNINEASVFSIKVDYRNIMCLKTARNKYICVNADLKLLAGCYYRNKESLFHLFSVK